MAESQFKNLKGKKVHLMSQLPTAFVVCEELHGTDKCNKPRNDAKAKKYINCGCSIFHC